MELMATWELYNVGVAFDDEFFQANRACGSWWLMAESSGDAALNPCFNVHGVEFLIESISTDLKFFDNGYATKAKKWFIDSLEGLYNIYYTKYGNLITTTESSSGASSSRTSGGNQMTRLLNRLKEHKTKKAMSDPSLSSEYERYAQSDFVTHLQATEFAAFDVLGFWKANETMFPILSHMAMDIQSVQATSVASEFAFSTSGMVLSIRRTRLTPTSLEMCMCLKDHLDAQERKQDKSTLETPVDFEEEILDAEMQENKAISLSDKEIALDVASSECSMSGPGSGGEEAYQVGLESLEARIVVHQKNEAVYEEDIALLKLDVQLRNISIKELKNQLESTLKEKDDLKLKLEKFETSSNNLAKLIGSQLDANNKTGLGYGNHVNGCEANDSKSVSDEEDGPVNDRFKKSNGNHAVPPPYTWNYMPPRADLSFVGLYYLVYKCKGTGQRETRQVWDNTARVNHQNKLTHPHPKRNFVPTAILTKSGQVSVNAAKQSSHKAAASVSAARRVNTAALDQM
nr:zinc finger BED domain-containing protein RICESLEEPER 2-like [Tanacetum cinerariifolium]